ncbi:MAG: GNAT family N-acetyltransferase [Proteobacteria bacterium]|nr:GNAT family N-acetyltransferase [Pseudomonadota bacterium]NBP14720.1 GNAT family N-acetyltransferase [bacterium]
MLNANRLLSKDGRSYMNYKKLVVALLVFAGSGAGYWYWSSNSFKIQSQQNQISSIVAYAPEKHRAFIKEQFKQNWYWLISSADYDVDYMLETRSPNNYEPHYKGKLSIVVLQEQEQLVGFGAYYMKNSFEGTILFIDIDQAFRGKRYAEKLVKYAEQDLKGMGAKVVKLATWIENASSRKLYTRLGYQEVNQERQYVHYRKEL